MNDCPRQNPAYRSTPSISVYILLFPNYFFHQASSLPSPLILKRLFPAISSLPSPLILKPSLPSISSLPDSLNSESPPFDSRSSCLNQSSQYGNPLVELNCLTSPYSMTKVHLWVPNVWKSGEMCERDFNSVCLKPDNRTGQQCSEA